MPVSIFKRCCAWPLLLAWLILLAGPANAHDPFDGSAQATVLPESIELKVTLGFDASREFLQAGQVPPADVARATRLSQSNAPVSLPLALAPRLMSATAAGQLLAPTAFIAAPGRDETHYLLVYPRPSAARVQVRAVYFDTIEHMRAGVLIALDDRHRLLINAPMTRGAPSVEIPMTVSERNPGGAPSAADSFTSYFKLGVEHILGGFDHLLFLCALLLSVTRIKPMLAVVTAFTLAHSVTLALAALNVVALSPSIVEPLIAVSIIIACIDNLVRREATRDRYWMAAAFGLIHGFGFAGALREEGLGQGGESIALPLFSFNLGVEAGQLLVAAVFIPLLLLARRRPEFVRYGLPALSIVVILVSAVWLLQRVGVL